MRVLYILNDSRPSNGANKAIVGIASQLRAMEVEPVWVLPLKPGPFEGLDTGKDEVLWLDYRSTIYPPLQSLKDFLLFIPRIVYQVAKNLKAIHQLENYLRQQPVDIIHTNVSVMSWGLMVAKRLGIPHVTHVREHVVKEYGMRFFPSKRWVYRQLALPQNHNICITRDILRHHHLDDQNSCVIYDGVCAAMSQMPTMTKENYFLFVGRIEYGKGVDMLLHGYAEYARQVAEPIPLWLAGEATSTDFKAEIDAYITSHNLEQSVQFLGPRKDVPTLMQQAKALIVSSRFEGFGFCLAEGMFNGCLCIGYDVSGTHEQLENGQRSTGAPIALAYSTTEQLAAHLTAVSETTDSQWSDMLRRAYNTVNSRYTYERSAIELMNLYKSLNLND